MYLTALTRRTRRIGTELSAVSSSWYPSTNTTYPKEARSARRSRGDMNNPSSGHAEIRPIWDVGTVWWAADNKQRIFPKAACRMSWGAE